MSIERMTQLGNINITSEAIAQLAGGVVTECYGVVGMASKHQVRDGFVERLGKENYSRGVVVENNDGLLDVDLYIIVGYGVKISEVANNIQTSVKYRLEKTFGLTINTINIHVQGVRMINTDE